jgi:hypothetical protein
MVTNTEITPEPHPTVHLEPHDVTALVRYIARDAAGDPHAAAELTGYVAAVMRQHGIQIPSDRQ